MAQRKRLWIQQAIKQPGALRRQLGIKSGQKIPESVLQRLAEAGIGARVKADGTVTVTRQLKRRAVLARTLRRLGGRRRRRRA
jgi:hypothetical protein